MISRIARRTQMQSMNKRLEEAHATLRASLQERKALRSSHASIQAQVCGMGVVYGVMALRATNVAVTTRSSESALLFPMAFWALPA